jgi:NADPH-dependent curcumin reductase CurA
MSGEVLESNDPEFRVGDIVLSMLGWREVFDAALREHGIEQAPAAFLKLFSGENIGKTLVKL